MADLRDEKPSRNFIDLTWFNDKLKKLLNQPSGPSTMIDYPMDPLATFPVNPHGNPLTFPEQEMLRSGATMEDIFLLRKAREFNSPYFSRK